MRHLTLRKREYDQGSNDAGEDRVPESVKKASVHIKPVREMLGFERLVDLTAEVIEGFAYRRLRSRKARGAGTISPSKVNRETAMLRSALLLAQKRGKIPRVPEIVRLDEPEPRQGFWSSFDEFESFVDHLPDDDHRDLASCGYWTGWRLREVFQLPWKYVDWNAAPHPEIRIPRTKNRQPRIIPIVGPLREVLERRWERRKVTREDGTTLLADLVFHKAGKPFRDYRRAWASAFRLAGIPKRTWHDFRRTAARNMVNAGVPEKVAMEITGHLTRSIFDRYHIVAQREKVNAFEKTFSFVNSQRGDGRVRRLRKRSSEDK